MQARYAGALNVFYYGSKLCGFLIGARLAHFGSSASRGRGITTKLRHMNQKSS
jgi:hypothetical protein